MLMKCFQVDEVDKFGFTQRHKEYKGMFVSLCVLCGTLRLCVKPNLPIKPKLHREL